MKRKNAVWYTFKSGTCEYRLRGCKDGFVIERRSVDQPNPKLWLQWHGPYYSVFGAADVYFAMITAIHQTTDLDGYYKIVAANKSRLSARMDGAA